MQDSERRIMPNVWLRISADTSRLSVQLKGPPTFFAQNYRRSTRPGRVSIYAGLQIPIFWEIKIGSAIFFNRHGQHRQK
jgi:hypothetical protein